MGFSNICKVESSNKVAIIHDNGKQKETLNYIEFVDFVGRLSNELQGRFTVCKDEKVVAGVYSEANVYLPIIVYTLLYYPAVFVPISLKTSSALFASTLKKCGVRYMFVQKTILKMFMATLNKELIVIVKYDIECIDDYVLLELNVESVFLNTDISYIVQSSGTTNLPKLIMVPEKCVIPNVIDLKNIFAVVSTDVIFISSALTFDASIVQMLLTWSSGASMLLVPSDVICNGLTLCDTLQKNQVSVIQCTPSLLLLTGQQLLKKHVFNSGSPIRVLALGGERMLSREILFDLMSHKETVQVYNIYGTSEVSAWGSIYQVKLSEITNNTINNNNVIDWVPIGVQLSNTTVEVYDENGQIVDDGPGEIWIGSKERVCLIDEETVSNDTVKMRPTGDIGEVINKQIYYCGRIDDRVKRNGQLINLDILKITVERMHNINSCCCLYRRNEKSMKEKLFLYICVLCTNKIEETEHEILRIIRKRLSTSYLPDEIVFVHNFPITSHGKIDKQALLAGKTNIIQNQSTGLLSLDGQLNHCWRLSLNSNTAPKNDDNFVECGGDSFSVAFLVNKLAEHIKNYSTATTSVCYEELFKLILTGTFCEVGLFINNAVLDLSIKNREIGDLKHKENMIESVHSSVKKRKIGELTHQKNVAAASNLSSLLGHKHFKAFFRQNKSFECVHSSSLESPPYFTQSGKLLFKLTERWKYDLKKCIDASPLVVLSNDSNDGIVYIGSHSHIFAAISLSSGVKVWEQSLGDRIESSATISKDANFICVGCYDGVLYVLDRYTGKISWEYHADDAIKSSPCTDIQNGIIVTGSHDQHVHALDIIRKKCLWKVFFASSCFSSPLIDEKRDLVYVCLLSGKMFALVLATGIMHWQIDFNQPIFSSPCLCLNCIIVGCVDGALYAVDYTGNKLWEFKTGAPIFSSPVCLTMKTNEFILFGSNDKWLYCINSGGELIWKYETNAPIYASVGICNNCGFDNKANVLIKDIKIGSKHNYHKQRCIGGTLHHSTISNIDYMFIVLASTNGQIFILNAQNGKCIALHKLPGEIFSSPVVIGNKIIVGCRDNNVYCFDLDACSKNT